MKKIIAAIVIIIIIILIILGIRSCEPRKKPGAGDPYFMPFINASVEYVCTVTTDLYLEPDSEEAEQLLNEIYKKHGLPTENNTEMIEIFQRFENNEEVQNKISENLNDCSDFS